MHAGLWENCNFSGISGVGAVARPGYNRSNLHVSLCRDLYSDKKLLSVKNHFAKAATLSSDWEATHQVKWLNESNQIEAWSLMRDSPTNSNKIRQGSFQQSSGIPVKQRDIRGNFLFTMYLKALVLILQFWVNKRCVLFTSSRNQAGNSWPERSGYRMETTTLYEHRKEEKNAQCLGQDVSKDCAYTYQILAALMGFLILLTFVRPIISLKRAFSRKTSILRLSLCYKTLESVCPIRK